MLGDLEIALCAPSQRAALLTLEERPPRRIVELGVVELGVVLGEVVEMVVEMIVEIVFSLELVVLE